MDKTDRLYVLWREPTVDGTRHIIGHLAREAEGYSFAYALPLDDAEARGFELLVEFPSREERYTSSYLFSTFAQRVPHPLRPDRQRLLTSWGVVHGDDAMEVLARSGGIQATDRLELAEFRPDDDALATPLFVRVAGLAHHAGGAHIDRGDVLHLERECLDIDPYAVRIWSAARESVGYVPRQYARLVSRLLEQGTPVSARAVRQLPDPDSEQGRWVVKLSRE